MKVIFLTRKFYPDFGGVEKHVFEVSRELIKRGHEVIVFSEIPSSYQSRYQSDTYNIISKEVVKSSQSANFEYNEMSIQRFNFGKEGFFKKFKIWAKLLTKMSIISNSDVVHCHDVFFWYLPFRFLYPRKKVFTTFHGHETKFPPTLKSKIIRRISEKLSFGNICVGDFIKKWYGTKPDYVTYGGVNIEPTRNLNPQIISDYENNQQKLNVLIIGRLEDDNGARIYLKALRSLKKEKVAYNLVVCGRGKYEKSFKELGELAGFTSKLNNYIDRSDFILASSYLSIFEAIVRGKKVFAVYENALKRDYLLLSPFKKYISISSDHIQLIKNLKKSCKSDAKSYRNQVLAQSWAKDQTWSNVADIYIKLWKT